MSIYVGIVTTEDMDVLSGLQREYRTKLAFVRECLIFGSNEIGLPTWDFDDLTPDSQRDLLGAVYQSYGRWCVRGEACDPDFAHHFHDTVKGCGAFALWNIDTLTLEDGSLLREWVREDLEDDAERCAVFAVNDER